MLLIALRKPCLEKAHTKFTKMSVRFGNGLASLKLATGYYKFNMNSKPTELTHLVNIYEIFKLSIQNQVRPTQNLSPPFSKYSKL